MPLISISDIESYRRCPGQYRFRLQASQTGLEPKPTQVSAVIYMRAVRRIQQSWLKGTPVSDRELRRCFELQWTRAGHSMAAPNDDYPGRHLKWAALESVLLFAAGLQRSEFGKPEASFVSVQIPIPRSRFRFVHRIHLVTFSSGGVLEVVRHRFGPVHPSKGPIPIDISADIWAAGFRYGSFPDGTIEYFPWFDTKISRGTGVSAIRRWIRAISTEIRCIENDIHFHYRPGPHCLFCPYEQNCPAFGKKNKNHSVFAIVHDPSIRIAEFYRSSIEEMAALKKNIHDAEQALDAIIRKTGDLLVRDIEGRPILLAVPEFRLPPSGSVRRRKLATLLEGLRYGKRITGRGIINWMAQIPMPKKIKKQIMDCMVVRYRFRVVDNRLPVPSENDEAGE